VIAGLRDEAPNQAGKPEGVAVGYLASEYPAISHTFILREIQALRARGIEVHTASIHLPEHELNEEEESECKQTLYLLNTPWLRLAVMTLKSVFTSPGAAFRMLQASLNLRRQARIPLLRLAAYFVEAVALLEWAVRAGVRHVHVHFANPAATVAMLAAASGKIEFSVSVHGPDVFYDVAGSLLEEKVRRARFVRCISYFCRSQLMRLVPHTEWHKLHIVRCGVDPLVFCRRPAQRNTAPNIICVGRLVPAKAQHLLLAACKTLRDRGHKFRVTFLGDGADREALKTLALQCCLAECTTFTLGVKPEQVNEHLDRADIMVLPSFAEGLPVVLMEAMAKEIPCVSSRIMGIPELIEHEQNGLLTAPSDLDDLVAQIERLLQDGDLRARLGREGRKKVVAEFILERTAELMYALFVSHSRGAGQ